MAKTSIDIWTCDRCGSQVEIRQGDENAKWGSIAVHSVHLEIGTSGPAHLCEKCMEVFDGWWTGQAKLPEPKPAQPVPPKKRAILSLADINELKGDIHQLISTNVASAYQLACISPDLFVDRMPPNVPVEIIREEAGKLVDGFVALHGLRKS